MILRGNLWGTSLFVVPTVVLTRLALYLGVPRPYAFAKDSRWFRVHVQYSVDLFVERLQAGEPMAVSMKDFIDGGYVDTQPFFVFDIDCKEDFEATKAAVKAVAAALDARGVSPENRQVTFTGKKGFRIWVFLDEPLPSATLAAFQNDVLRGAGFEQVKKDAYRRGLVMVETLILDGDGGIVKVPFSRHQDQERHDFFEVPVDMDQVQAFDKDALPSDALIQHGIELFNKVKRLEALIVLLQVEEGPGPVVKRKKKVRRGAEPEKTDNDWVRSNSSPRMVEMVEKVATTPCLQECFGKAVAEDHIFWERAVLAFSLAACGFSKADIAAYFVAWVNDADDDAHPDVLRYQVNYWADRYTHCRCDILKEEAGNKRCCPGPCGRLNPTDPEPILKLPVPEVTVLKDGKEMEAFFDGVVKNDRHSIIYGSPRSGKTTGIGMALIRNHRDAVVMLPRIAIAQDTWAKVLEEAKGAGLECHACYLPDIRCACLRLAMRIELQRKEHDLKPGQKCAMELAMRWGKPNCHKCRHKDDVSITPAPNYLHGDADTAAGICGYQTVVQNAAGWNLVLISDKKFVAISSLADEDVWSPLMSIITTRDCYVLDETSGYLEAPSAELDVYALGRADPKQEYKFIEVLRNEVGILEQVIATKVAPMTTEEDARKDRWTRASNQLRELYKKTKMEISEQQVKVLGDISNNVFVYKRELLPEERKQILKAGKLIQAALEKKAMDDNQVLESVYDMLAFSTELEWIFCNDPNSTSDPRITIKIAPKVVPYVNSILSNKSQVIALDIMPSIIDLDRLFGVTFKRYNIGDRNGLYDNLLIIPDSRHINASGLLQAPNIGRLTAELEYAVALFGEEKMGLLFANMNGEREVLELLKSKFSRFDVRHHRGTKTMGVHCDRRVGFSICAPFAPKTAMHWLKKVYPFLKDISAWQLWNYEQQKQTQQGEARYVDPSGGARSVVFAFGQTEDNVRRNYTNAIVKPAIAKVPRYGASRSGATSPPLYIVLGYLWIEHGRKVVDDKELLAIRAILDGAPDVEVVNRSRLTVEAIKELRWLLLKPISV